MEFKIIGIIIFGFITDLIIGDPPNWPHPVKFMGKLIDFLDKKLNHNKKIDGIYMLLIVLLTVGILGGGLLILAYQLHFGLGLLVESAMLATTLSQKGLKAAATAVYAPLSKDNLIAARQQLSYIVGRDTENLNEEGITRATVETVAENTTDGITAPIFWAAIGGGLGALIYRAINTCDSMVAYHNEKYENFGWASAKLDDLVNYLPARLTGYLMLQTRKRYRVRKNISFNHLKKEANKHPSPNSGWTEAATALLLGVKLGGNNYYQGVRFEANQIGKARKSLEKDDIIRAVDIMEITNLLFLFTIILGVFLYVFAQTWF